MRGIYIYIYSIRACIALCVDTYVSVVLCIRVIGFADIEGGGGWSGYDRPLLSIRYSA